MKKLALALAATAAFAGQAFAADMGRPYTKAPVAVPVAYNWTGCFIGAGAGYGWYNTESTQVVPATGAFVVSEGTSGGRGWLGNVQGGCDYQFSGPMGNWVIGAFADYSFMDVKGDHIGVPLTTGVGPLKQDYAWAAGARIGYLVNPTFLTYFNAGWTQTHFKQVDYLNFGTLLPNGFSLPGSTYDGWFIGSGFEYQLSFLPGLFLKSEYRYSQFDRKQINNIATATGLPTGTAETVKPFTQSLLTSVVYRFNFGR